MVARRSLIDVVDDAVAVVLLTHVDYKTSRMHDLRCFAEGFMNMAVWCSRIYRTAWGPYRWISTTAMSIWRLGVATSISTAVRVRRRLCM